MTQPALQTDARKLMRQLHRLGPKIEGKVSRRAVSAGATPILRAMKDEVPIDQGTLKASLGKKTKLYKRSGTAIAMTGPRIKGGQSGYHGHLIENGKVNVDGSFTPGNPFMARAQDKAASEARRVMHAKLAAGIEQEARRA